jgi:hypothetical protein
MPDTNGYAYVGEGVQPVAINPVRQLPVPANSSYSDDIEVINLDDPRGNIKPTTWH